MTCNIYSVDGCIHMMAAYRCNDQYIYIYDVNTMHVNDRAYALVIIPNGVLVAHHTDSLNRKIQIFSGFYVWKSTHRTTLKMGLIVLCLKQTYRTVDSRWQYISSVNNL